LHASGIKAAAVLLAAGLSRRMGPRNKLLIPIGGEPLVRRTAKVYLAAGVSVNAVLGHEAELVRAALHDLPLSFTFNPLYETEGQHSSVRAGLNSLAAGYDAVMIALADQPSLEPSDISMLLAAFAQDPGRILVPYFEGRRGNPTVFPGSILMQLRRHCETAPLRSFAGANPGLTLVYQAADAHFVTDIDTPDDLAAFEEN
jgi:molybdenum cofactor cytidylyltransferase